MKIDELMIGDWVYSHGKFCNDKRRIRKEDFFKDFNPDPISLTQEILEKNGFTKERDYGGTFKIKDGLDLVHAGMFSLHSYEFCGDDGGMNSACTGIYVDYVHELEHVLKQCEIEKIL